MVVRICSFSITRSQCIRKVLKQGTEEEKHQLTFFLNDRLNKVMDEMDDRFVSKGSHVNDRSFLWDMILKKLLVSIYF